MNFEGYYKNLTNDQTQVSSYFEISSQCALLTVVACAIWKGEEAKAKSAAVSVIDIVFLTH